MAYSSIEQTLTVSKQDFVLAFSGPTPGYLDKAHVVLYINGDLGSVLGASLFFNSSVNVAILGYTTQVGDVVQIRRETPIDSPLVDFSTGASLSEFSLDTATRQLLYISQEALDGYNAAPTQRALDMGNQLIENVKDPEKPQDAATDASVEAAITARLVVADAAAAAALASAGDADASAVNALASEQAAGVSETNALGSANTAAAEAGDAATSATEASDAVIALNLQRPTTHPHVDPTQVNVTTGLGNIVWSITGLSKADITPIGSRMTVRAAGRLTITDNGSITLFSDIHGVGLTVPGPQTDSYFVVTWDVISTSIGFVTIGTLICGDFVDTGKLVLPLTEPFELHINMALGSNTPHTADLYFAEIDAF